MRMGDCAFPQGLKLASFAGLDDTAEAVPCPKPSDDAGFRCPVLPVCTIELRKTWAPLTDN